MESYGNIIHEEWVSMSCCDQDSNHYGVFSSEHCHGLDLDFPVWPSANESNTCNSCVMDDQILAYDFSHQTINAADSLPYPGNDFFQFCTSKTPTNNEGDSSNFLLLAQLFSDDAMEEILCLKEDEVVETPPVKRKYEMLKAFEDEGNNRKFDSNPKKKTRVSRDNKNKKNSPPKKQKMITSNEDELSEESSKRNAQSVGSCCSEDDSSQDLNETANNLIAKPRAGRGAATDPQSIYARKRRERINERLRILQNLVPNGTKVDISTMLEEAVHYVKFLQLQIKLLSSDDKWMYAPIAYNGMDMGLYQNISPTL